MNIEKIRSRKALKLLGLLISSLLIATVSAQVYNYMFLNATIGVEGATLQWTLGEDNATAGTQIAGATATLDNLKGWTNATRIYPDPVRLENIAGSDVIFDLLIDEVSGGTGQMESILVRLISMNTTTNMGNLTVWQSPTGEGANLTSLTMPNGHIWKVQWEITWKSTATTETVTVKLKVKTE
jgi:hypothetical protein